jgi:hypothetical protein
MGFQVAPERVGRRRAMAPGIAVVIVSLAVIGFGLLSSGSVGGPIPGPSSPVPTVAVVVASSPSAAPTTTSAAALPSTPRPYPGPDAIDCHDAGIVLCGEIAGAAVKQLPTEAPAVESVGVWTSILCRDTSDCPAFRFEGYRPLGSAIVSFGSGLPVAWVNVVEPAPESGRALVPGDVQAWIIHWAP